MVWNAQIREAEAIAAGAGDLLERKVKRQRGPGEEDSDEAATVQAHFGDLLDAPQRKRKRDEDDSEDDEQVSGDELPHEEVDVLLAS